uniref:hypothetical protein n=1 Tax=uncultured Draconibacterium sp. TaxID=1573823 RepID=UPI003216847B
MKTQGFLIFIFILTFLTSCEKDEIDNIANGITFRQFDIESGSETDATIAFVKYDEIIGYDSLKYAFVLKDAAWEKIKNGIAPVSPDPNFGFIVALNNKIIYRVAYIQPYSSMALFDIVTLRIEEPNIVYMELGYPASPEHFTGEDLRNDLRLIKQLEKDNKLIEIEN